MQALFFTAFLLIAAVSLSQPQVYLMNPKRISEVKKKADEKDKATVQLLNALVKQSDALLDMKPLSVMDKKFSPVSGNRHDYMSQAPYFWYDSSKPNGLPYIRRDGQHNPEIKKITDHDYLSSLDNAVRTLAAAWYFTGNEKYAAKASSLIRYWFFDETTKMNPNLEYAQGIPGINNGRGIGIIETRSLTGIADAVGLLQNSKSWTGDDTRSLKNWYSQYLNWMLTSKNGNNEHNAKNNHGTWYLDQAIDFALFTGNNDKAKQLSEEAKKKIDSQITAEGKQPLELERTNALGYSTFNLRAWMDVATLAEITGTDLWNYKNVNGSGLRTALNWLEPYALGEKKWSYQQIGNYNKSEFYPLLMQAAVKYNNPQYFSQAAAISSNDILFELLYRK